jgi:foldase protein PrsA
VTIVVAGVMIVSFAGCSLVEITKGDVDLAIKPYLEQYKEQYGSDFESKEELKEELKNLRKKQLDGLVDQEVLLQSKKELDVNPSDEEIQTQVDDRVKYYKNLAGSDEQYEKMVDLYGYNSDSFQEYLKIQVVVGMLVQKITDDVQVVDEDIQSYYEHNIDKYTKKAGANVTHLLFQPTKDANGNIVAGSDEVARAKADAAKVKAAAGTSLKDLSNSEEFKSGDKFISRYEDLGRLPFESSGMVKEFEVAFKKLQANQVSDVVKTDFGYHIIVNTNVYPNDEVITLDDNLKEIIKADALQQKQFDIYKEKVEELKGNIKIKLYEDKL